MMKQEESTSDGLNLYIGTQSFVTERGGLALARF